MNAETACVRGRSASELAQVWGQLQDQSLAAITQAGPHLGSDSGLTVLEQGSVCHSPKSRVIPHASSGPSRLFKTSSYFISQCLLVREGPEASV